MENLSFWHHLLKKQCACHDVENPFLTFLIITLIEQKVVF